MDTELIKAYRATRYCVDGPAGSFEMKIDRHCPALAELLTNMGVDCAAFVTAWNPHSVPTDVTVNQTAQQFMQEELLAQGYDCVPGKGWDVSGQWPAELSVLVPGISVEETLSLGRRYRQNAVVYANSDAVPVLMFPFESF